MRVLSYGDTGPEVDLLQSTLKDLGYYTGKIDGIFGKQTEAAVKKFQKNYELEPDGIVGPLTFDKLFPYINGYTLYRVEPGDTFYQLAQKFNTNVNFIINANPTVDPNNIPIGKTLVIPFGDVVPTNVRYAPSIMETNILALLAIYPFIEVQDIGSSVLGNRIPYIKIGRGAKKVLYVGAIHGTDWITSMMLMKFVEDYCKSIVTKTPIYGYAPFEIYDNATFYILPMLNPDGVNISTSFIQPDNEIYQGIKEAASRNPSVPFPTGWKANIRGVDLDLQFPAKWEEAKRVNYANGFTAPTSSNFPGYAPLTEPESVAIYNFALANSFANAIIYQTSGQTIYWKYNTLIPEGAEYLANTFKQASGYALADPAPAYANGTLQDWFIQDFFRPGFVIKPGTGTPPVPVSQFDKIYSENLGILIYGALL